MRKILLISVAVLLVTLLLACVSPAPTPTPTPVPPTATPKPTEPAPVAQTETGKKAFTNYCGGCHSAGFDKTLLARYGTAKKLFDYIGSAMPPGNPDIVSAERRYDIVAHLLSVQGFITAAQAVNAETAANITMAEPTPPASALQAETGKKAFASYCSCHGRGFSKTAIAGYGTADKLYQYIRQAMPPGNPDVLSDQKRYDIVSYLATEQGLLRAGQGVDSSTAGGISLR